MMKQIFQTIYAGNPDAIIWLVIIVVTVIAQIVKAGRNLARKAPGGAEAAEPPRRQPSEPREELREFLESLTGARSAPPPPRNDRLRQQHAQTRRKVSRTAPPPPLPRIAAQTAPGRPQTRPTTMRKRAAKESTGHYTLKTRTSFESGVLTAQDLKGKASLRKAIALMEIFGAPRGLRQPHV